jgi:hypothetical protein
METLASVSTVATTSEVGLNITTSEKSLMLLRNSKDGEHLKKAARTRLDNVTVSDRLSMLAKKDPAHAPQPTSHKLVDRARRTIAERPRVWTARLLTTA